MPSYFFLFCIALLMQTVQADNITLTEKTGSDTVNVYYFWSRYCPHCKVASPFIKELAISHPWLILHSYDVVDNPANQKRYVLMAQQLGQSSQSVPAFIFCKQMLVGFDQVETTGKILTEKLITCHEQGITQSQAVKEHLAIPWFGEIDQHYFSLPVLTLIIATLDAFNPCAFFILFFLLSLMIHHRSRIKMFVIGCTFVLCSGVMYFLFMSAWLNLFLMTGQLIYITVVAGLVAVGFGLLNIKDYLFFKQGLSLSLSDSSKSKLLARIRILSQTGHWPTMMLATLVLAVAANSYELLCTAGLPMVYTRILTLNALTDVQYYLYLVLYNVIYIIPLLIIVILFTLTLGSKKLSEYEGRLLKLLSGSMMLGLGGILLFNPEWLGNMLISIGVMLGSVFLTLLTMLISRWHK